MKKLFINIILICTTIVLFVGFSNNAFSQCNIIATADNQIADTVYICEGEHVKLHSWGNCDDYLMDNNFNNGSIGAGWSTNASPMFNNPCVSGPDGSTCLWIGPATNFPRELVTLPFNVTTSCTICFDMIYSVQGVSSPCEGPDLPTEGVHLQWSNNGGTTWTDIQYWSPNGGHDPALTNWHNYCCNVPVAGNNVQFRWYQSNTSGNNYDHWGIDNVVITCPQTSNVWWTGPGGFTYNNYHPPSFAPTQNGWYVVHLTDGVYIGTDSIYVLIHPQLYATITPVNPTLCFGQTSTVISGIPSGGTPPYTYLWNTGATTQSINGGPGTYTLLVNDASGCTPVSVMVTITSYPVAVSANAGANQILCNTNTIVSLTGTVTAATGGIWSGGTGVFLPSNTSLNCTYTPTPAEVIAGNVILTLTTTGNGTCPADTDNVLVNFVSFSENITFSTNNVNCYNGTNGTATVNITSGVPPYTYLWNTTPQQTGQTATGLTQGTYFVTVTNGNGCTKIASIAITQPQPLTAVINSTDVSCFGLSNGSLLVSAFGGTPGYSYNWSNGYNGLNLTGVTAGNYTVTVTDAKGCTTTVTSSVGSPALLTVNISNSVNVFCSGESNGSAQLAVNGGTPGYTYFWSSGAGTSQTASGLIAGTYFVTVTDFNGCQANTSVVITQPDALAIVLSTSNVSCYGGNNGTASVIVSGGTPNYMYSWSPNGGNTANATGLLAGNYTITVTDSKGCQQTTVAVISQPPPLSVMLNNVANVLCFSGNNGSASISVNGGTPGYTYQWLPTGGSSPIATGLPAGNYMVSVTDANFCVSQLNVFVSQPSSALTSTYSQSNVSCFGGQTGSITANTIGGTGPYSYFWQPSGSTTQTLSNIGAGTYFVTISDANGCSLTNSINITQPGGILLTTSTTQSTCGSSNGTATVTPIGGTPPFSYLWQPGAVTTSTINNISSGLYSVTVTDFSGCSQIANVALNDVSGPVVAMAAIQNVSCFGGHDGTATVNVSGGLAPYTYSWSPYGGNGSTGTGLGAGTFVVLVNDANGCQGIAVTNPEITQPPAISISSTQINITCTGANNGSVNLSVNGGTAPYTYLWSNGPTIPNLTGLSPAVYQVTVTDSHNCQDFYFVTFVEPTPLSVSINTFQNVSCFGGFDGSATASVSGGTPPYNFSWSPGGATSQTASGLSAGTHTVYVTDSRGCSGSASIFLSQPSYLSILSGFTNPECHNGNDGFAWVLAAGGTPPYNYNWSPIGGTNDTASNLQAGIYYVTVTDQHSCQSFVPVIISQPSSVDISITNYSDVSCYGGSDGNALASVSGGVPAYTYNWSTGSNSPGITGLTPNTYFVTVTDSKGCFDTSSVVIHAPLLGLSVNATAQNISCYGMSDGTATAVASGGTSPYSYVWVPASQFTATASNLISGTYTISVTDINGCQITTSISLSQPQPLVVTANEDLSVSCYSTNTGAASAIVSGGTPPYNYNWNTIPAQTTSNVTDIYSGNYNVSITDANGCTSSSSIIVSEPTALTAVLVSHSDVSCHDGSNGIATVGATGGTPPYNITWGTTPQQSGQTATGLVSGSYSVTVTDNNGCLSTIVTTISNPTQVNANATGQNVICLGESTTLTAVGSGGAGNYLYYWNHGLGLGNTKTVSPVTETTYIVNAYDQNGCPGIGDTITVFVKTLFPQDVDILVNSPVCAGTQTTVYSTSTVGMFDTLTYAWNNGLGPGEGPFIVAPQQETTYIITVTNTCGFSVIDSVHLYFAPPPTIYFNADATQGCEPLTINFTDSSFTTFDDISSWTWHFSDGTSSTLQHPTHTFATSDTFYVSLDLETQGGCVSSSATYPLEVYVFPNPSASFTVNATTLYLPNDPVVCTNTSIGGVGYLWNFGDGNTSVQDNPTHNYMNLGQFTISLVTVNTYGCTDTSSILVNATGDIIFPNAFTPDPNHASGGTYDPTDLTNHVFFPFATGITEFKMLIFNRWGELIYETNDVNIGWDGYYRGQLCQEDVYVFKASASFIDGRKVDKVGDILLLR
ncbi:MAG: gliding motility-associated C-terminal domain-containing protein [Bacteroidia bacterium]|nr:gliding motility-associated C-terminal domain-containing protein [Bacteroidia bacterium]